MRLFLFFFSVLALTALTQCASYDFAHRVAQQGNLISPEKFQQLKIGMSKEDVAILMGTSLMSPMFQNDRWDYAYTWQRGNGPLLVNSMTLVFAHDRLVHMERL